MDSAALRSQGPVPAGGSRSLHDHAGYTAEVDTIGPEAWDRILGGFEDASYDQTACYADGRWGIGRTSRLLMLRDGVPVAGAQVALVLLPFPRRGVAFVKFGPFWRARRARRDINVYRAVVSALVHEYCTRRNCTLTLAPRPHPEHYRSEIEILSQSGFEMRRPYEDRNRYFVDLSLGADEQMRSLDKRWRYTLNRALANRFDISMEDGEAALAAFAALHRAMVARKRFYDCEAVHLLPGLSARLPAGMRPRVALACHSGRPVAGAVVAVLGDVAYYVHGASDDAALPLSAGYALQWWILRWLSDKGVRWYDLGGEALEPGLRHFKKGLAGKRGTVLSLTGEYDRWPNLQSRWMADLIYGAREAKRAIRSLRRAKP